MARARREVLPPIKPPRRGAYHVLDVRVPQCITTLTSEPDAEGCLRADITVDASGAIEEVVPRGAGRIVHPLVHGQGRQCWPGFVDIHAHLDKTATWERAPNEDGSFDGAIEASRAARRQPWSSADIFARMDEAAEEAAAMGTVAIRTHIDSSPQRADASWPAFERLIAKWRDRLAIQSVALFSTDAMMGRYGERLADIAAKHRASFGPVIYPSVSLAQDIQRAFELAERRGLDLDFHVDETGGALAHGLDAIADMAISRKFRGRIVCGHACSLSLHDDEPAARTIAKLARANIGVVSLPATNLYLQARQKGRTPVWRGVTRLHELRTGGVHVAIAGDNRRDAFYPFGDYDMLDVFRDAVRIAHLDMPMAGWVDAVSKVPADLMGLPHLGRIAPGASADLTLFPVRAAVEVLASRGADRQIMRKGQLIEG